jgi:hypothetical protein
VFSQLNFDLAQDSLQVVANLRVSKSNDRISQTSQDRVSHLVGLRLKRMVSPVELHDQVSRVAIEIHDKSGQHMLASKVPVQKLVCP